jgi:hypothetical protein
MASLILRAITLHISRHVARRLLIAGLSVSVLGALVVAWGSLQILRAMRSKYGIQRPNRIREKIATLAGFVLISIGLSIQVLWQLALSLRK